MSHDARALQSPNSGQPRTPYSQQQPLTPSNHPASPANRPVNTPTNSQAPPRTPQSHAMVPGTPTTDSMGPPLFPPNSQPSGGMSTSQNGPKLHTGTLSNSGIGSNDVLKQGKLENFVLILIQASQDSSLLKEWKVMN